MDALDPGIAEDLAELAAYVRRRTFAVVNGVPSRLRNTSASGDRSTNTASLRRSASAVKVGSATTRFERSVFGCGCRNVPTPFCEITVPQIRSVAGVVVTSTSQRRMPIPPRSGRTCRA